jgi:tetratricopeptide (TPR) repeat protein
MILKMKFDRLKRLAYVLLAVLLPLLSFGDDNTQALFEKGNTYYTKGQYQQAVAAYQQVVNSGYQSVALYYNMGNAEYKLGEIPSSLLYYEKAHKLAPADEDINVNIRFANLKTTDKIDEMPEFFLNRWWHGFILSFSVNALAVWSVLLVLVGSGLLILYFFANSVAIKKLSFYSSLTSFFIGLIIMAIAGSQVNYFDGHKQAIIFSGIVNVKSGPVDQPNTLFVLHEGTKVNVLDKANGWMRIKLANGNEGWLKISDVKEI